MELELDDWQIEALEHEGNLLLCTGRQIGKTTIMAIKCAKYMLKHKGSRIIIVSLTEDQAKLIILMILEYFERNHSKLIGKKKDKPTQNRIRLTTGSEALARPVGNTGDAVRGFTGDVLVIDEASRMPELAFEAAKPVLLTTAGKIWMCSTPHGKKGYFWESYQNKSNRFKVIHKSTVEAVHERTITKKWTVEKRAEIIKFLEDERKDMSEKQFGQEYLGLFLEDLRRFFDDSLINECCVLRRPEVYPKDNNYMGCDLARMGGDESTFEIIHVPEDEGKKMRQIENITTEKTLTTETEDRIIELTKTFNVVKVGIDAGSGSLGVSIYDHLLRKSDIKKKVVAMNNRAITLDREGKNRMRIFKEDLYDNLKAMMEHGDLLLLDDDNLRASLRSIQFEFEEDNGQRVNRVKIFGNYSHIVEGLIRAAWLAKKEKAKKMFVSYL